MAENFGKTKTKFKLNGVVQTFKSDSMIMLAQNSIHHFFLPSRNTGNTVINFVGFHGNFIFYGIFTEFTKKILLKNIKRQLLTLRYLFPSPGGPKKMSYAILD